VSSRAVSLAGLVLVGGMTGSRSAPAIIEHRGMGCFSRTSSWQVTAKSLHRGGVLTCWVDGSVRFLSDSVSQGVYQAIHSRDDGLIANP